MVSQGIHLVGSGLALLGWVGALLSCIIPMWCVTSFVGATIVTSETIWEGIWMNCVVQSTGQTQCDPYDSMLVLSSERKAAQVLTVGSLLAGSLGIILALIGGKCTRFLDYRNGTAKDRVATAAGVILIISGLLCLIPVTWAASTVVQTFYNPQITDAQKREIGPAIYIGWGASILLFLGGGMLCSTSCCQKAEDDSPSVNYRVVCSSRAASSIRMSQQVQVHSPSQKTKIPARSECSDGAPANQQQHKINSGGSRKSKISTTKSEEPMTESEQSDGPSTKSQLNYAGSDRSLESSESEVPSACPEKTYL
ncbi:claudin-4-like [Neoarius graeffei]|uniref:claudin-4-like n=1 Tax=Neoarius graeffei TaxID=443677 RepID=UPI00298BF3E6|nr:claudin-4-like [Neoarius graeffei]